MNRLAAERRLILISAGTSSHRQSNLSFARSLAAAVDWTQLAERLRARKLLPVVGTRIVEMVPESADDGFREALDEAIANGRRQGAFLQLISQRLTAMLAEAGIRSAPLKGPILSEAIHGDPGWRASSDIDLLVPPERLEDAVSVVRQMGYGPPEDFIEADGLPQLHFALIHEEGMLPPVELHWRIHWYERDFARERLLPPQLDPQGAWRPAPGDELAALLLFYARDGFIDLRLAADLAAWWDTRGLSLPRGALTAIIASYPQLARAIPASARAAEAVAHTPLRDALEGSPALGARERTAVRLANPNPHTPRPQLYAERGLIDGLLIPPGGFRDFVGRQLLPPQEVLDQQAGHGQRPQARSSLGRFTGVLGRYAFATTRLARRPEWAG